MSSGRLGDAPRDDPLLRLTPLGDGVLPIAGSVLGFLALTAVYFSDAPWRQQTAEGQVAKNACSAASEIAGETLNNSEAVSALSAH